MTKTMSKNLVVSQVAGNIVSDMDGEKVMLSVENGKYYNLGDIGGEIWELVEEPISIQELITRLVAQYDVTENECEVQVISFLDHMLAEDLIKVV